MDILESKSKLIIIAILVFLLGNTLFADQNKTHEDAYEKSIEAHEKGDRETSIKYLLLAEKLGNDDAYGNLCWICEHDKDNNLTKEWCYNNNCTPSQ